MFNECMEEKTKKVIFPGGFLGIAQGSEDGVVFDGGTENLPAKPTVMLLCHLITRGCDTCWQTACLSVNYDTDTNMLKIVGKETTLGTPCYCNTGLTSEKFLLFLYYLYVLFKLPRFV